MWLDIIKEWTQLTVDDLLDSAQDRTQRRKVEAEPSDCAPNDRLGQGMTMAYEDSTMIHNDRHRPYMPTAYNYNSPPC